MSKTNQFPVLLSVDMSETDSSYLVVADISHFHASDVSIDVWQDSLVVEMKTTARPGEYECQDVKTPELFRRVIPLGINIARKQLTSEVHDGTLAIRINKTSIAERSSNIGVRS